MNIANIFGMHMGCNVKTAGRSIGKLVSVSGDYDLVGVKENKSYHDDYVEYQIIDCKLLLTPLSKITEEDWEAITSKWDCKESWKAEKFEIREKIIEVKLSLDGDCQWYTLGRDEVFLLASKGYDIGIVEDEYKEM